jgi:hypothetical protein
VQVNAERALYWLRNGAQPSDVVKRLFIKEGVWSQFTGEPMPEAPAAEVPPIVVETPVVEQPLTEEVAPAAEEPTAATEEEAKAAE